MNDEIREVYLSDLEWTRVHDDMGGVMGNAVFKDVMSYEEYQKLFKTTYFTLCDKGYITNLEQENEKLKRENIDLCAYLLFKNRRIPSALTKNRKIQELLEIPTYEDYKSRVEKTTEKLSFIDEALENDTLNVPLCIAKINSALNILQNGSENNAR